MVTRPSRERMQTVNSLGDRSLETKGRVAAWAVSAFYSAARHSWPAADGRINTQTNSLYGCPYCRYNVS